MKYIILVPDGMADYPLRQLSWKTPLMAARAPVIKSLYINGAAATLPEPSTFMLLAVGMAGLVGCGRRKRKRE